MRQNGHMGQVDFSTILQAVQGAAGAAANVLSAQNQVKVLKEQAKIAQAQADAAKASIGQGGAKFFGLNPWFLLGAGGLALLLFAGHKRSRR